MPVAKKQMREILDILSEYVTGQEQLADLLRRLRGTDVYRTNRSYRVTVNRLVDASGMEGGH